MGLAHWGSTTSEQVDLDGIRKTEQAGKLLSSMASVLFLSSSSLDDKLQAVRGNKPFPPQGSFGGSPFITAIETLADTMVKKHSGNHGGFC